MFTSSGRLAGMVVSTLSDGTGRHLNLAHAVTAPMLAQFVCANTNCSAELAGHRQGQYLVVPCLLSQPPSNLNRV